MYVTNAVHSFIDRYIETAIQNERIGEKGESMNHLIIDLHWTHIVRHYLHD